MGSTIRSHMLHSVKHMQCYKKCCQYHVSSTLYIERKSIHGLYHKMTDVVLNDTHAVLQELLSVSSVSYLVTHVVELLYCIRNK